MISNNLTTEEWSFWTGSLASTSLEFLNNLDNMTFDYTQNQYTYLSYSDYNGQEVENKIWVYGHNRGQITEADPENTTAGIRTVLVIPTSDVPAANKVTN